MQYLLCFWWLCGASGFFKHSVSYDINVTDEVTDEVICNDIIKAISCIGKVTEYGLQGIRRYDSQVVTTAVSRLEQYDNGRGTSF